MPTIDKLQAKLVLDGRPTKYDVRDLDYELSKPYNNSNKPSGYPEGGIISFTILSPIKTNFEFHDWLLDVKKKGNSLIHQQKNGDFYLPITHGTEQTIKTLHFEMAYCVRLSEYYSSSNSSQMYLRIIISAQIIKFGENAIEFKNKTLQK